MVKITREIAIAAVLIMVAVNIAIFFFPIHVTKKDVAITFDYETFKERPVGGNAVMRHLLDVLEKYNVNATFFISGRTIEDNPDVVREIRRRGHSISVHAYAHEVMTELDEQKQRQVFENSATALDEAGIRLDGFRGPHYGANDVTMKLLKQYNFCYDSTLWRGYTLKPEVKEIAVLGPDDWWWYYGKNQTSQKEFAEELERVYFKNDGPIVIVMHPHIEENKDPDLIALDKLLSDLKSKGANFISLGGYCK